MQDFIHHIPGYKYFTELDISMQYYTFELDKESQILCAMITPFGKYKHKCLPMGLKYTPDFAQQIIEDVICGQDNVNVYLHNMKSSTTCGKNSSF
ncbi:hypothetical protein ACHAXS_000551 [Conticribra weissflogii]